MAKKALPKSKQREIATERLAILFSKADEIYPTNKGLATRYVTLARKLAMKVKLRMPKEYKRKYCKHCYKYMRPGVNCSSRVRDGKVIISCFECKKFTRIPIR